jgi:hypothetical protein
LLAIDITRALQQGDLGHSFCFDDGRQHAEERAHQRVERGARLVGHHLRLCQAESTAAISSLTSYMENMAAMMAVM